MSHDDIRIGTLVKAEDNAAHTIEQLVSHGFESFEDHARGREVVGQSLVAYDLARDLHLVAAREATGQQKLQA